MKINLSFTSSTTEWQINVVALFVLLLSGTTIHAQYTAIPDAAFEQRLITLGIDSGTIDGKVLTSNISSVTTLDVADNSAITNLTGIRDFASLEYLNCFNSNITFLNVTGLTNLKSINSYQDYFLTNVILTGCTALNNINFGGCPLTTISFAGLTAMSTIDMNSFNISELDLSSCHDLTNIQIYSEALQKLNLSGLTNMSNLRMNLGGGNITCIQVDDVATANQLSYSDPGSWWSMASWSKPAGASYSTNCNLTIPPTEAPTAAAQAFCVSGTVANLVATGTNLQWYDVATNGTVLATSTALATGTYFVSQTVSGNESARTSVAVTVNTAVAPTATATQVYAGTATLADLIVTGTAIQWYAAASGGSALANTTTLADGTIYYASQTLTACESTRVAVTVSKISEATQTFCPSATVTNLVSTPRAGATASWFTAPSGGAELVSTEALSTGTYYVEQSNPVTIATVASGFNFPYGVAVQADGKIIVASYGNSNVQRMNADGTDIVTLGSGFSNPTGVAVQADGKILVADFGNNAIKRMNADGTDIVTLGSGFSNPIAVAVQADGKILVSDFSNNAIKRMNADGTDIVTLGSGFSNPLGVAVQADGKIVVGDYSNNDVKRMNADGTGIVSLGSGFIQPMGVAVQADGKIVVADSGNSAIKRMNADGTGIVTLAASGFYPTGVALQADGTIVVVDAGNGAIKRISEGGVSNRVAVSVTITSTIWDGTTWSCGAPTATMDAIINSAYTTSTNGTISAKSLTVNASIGSLTINSNTKVTVQNAVVNNGTLTIENNANLIQVNDAANTGTATVKRNSNSLKRLDYTMWSSPVTGDQTLSDFSIYTTTTRFYTYNPANDKYTGAPASNPFVLGTGYLIRMPDQKPGQLGNATPYYRGEENLIYNGAFTGKPNNGTITLNSLTSGKYYAIGNPYPSTISATSFLDGNATGGTLYFWRKTNGVLGSAYATYTLAGGAGSNGIVPNGTIQVGQGFIVQTGTAATSLTFTNAMRTTESGSQFFKTKAATDKSRVWLSLSDAKNSLNQTMIAYMDGATLGLDAGYDGKYINDSKIALTSNIEGHEYIIQARPTFDATDVVALNFKTDVAGAYSIALDKFDGLFENGYDVYLVDAVTGKETNLKSATYSFTAAAGVDNTRFSLKYQKTLKVEAPVFNENSVTVYRNNGVVTVNSTSKAIKTVQVYDVQGRLIAQQKNVNDTKANFNNLKTASQVLIVKVIADDNTVVNKKVLN